MTNSSNGMKRLAKKAIRKSLLASKKALAKNKYTRRAGRAVKNVLFPGGVNGNNIYDYRKYAADIPEYWRQTKQAPQFADQPLISLVMPTYNTPVKYLEECIESVQQQSYANWELCIADDASPNKDVVATIKRYMKEDPRIKLNVRKQNGHISRATNSAIELASGEFIALLDHDDILWPNALYEIVALLNKDKKLDFIYTDEDKIDSDNEVHSYPVFKPDWSPEFLESCNYITHFACIRTTIMQQVGGFRAGYEGAQDWDLFMRVTQATDRIAHIPKVLYSWRIHEASTALNTDTKPYVYESQRNLLLDYVAHTGRKATVKPGIITQHSCIEYEVEGTPKVSVIVYGRNFDLFKRSVASVLKYSEYPNTELLLAPGDARCAAYAKRVQHAVVLPVIASPSTACNRAAAKATGEYLVFVDGTMTINTPRWLEWLVGDAQRPGVGLVGGKTIDREKDRIMRAGVGMGVYGLYAPLLEGMPVEDIHYMRGLYGQSRRNTSAVDSGCSMLRRSDFEALGGFAEDLDDMFIVDLCLRLLKKDKRIIYNPFIETVDLRNFTAGEADQARDKQAIAVFKKKWAAYIKNDPYFDPGFTRTNAQLDIR